MHGRARARARAFCMSPCAPAHVGARKMGEPRSPERGKGGKEGEGLVRCAFFAARPCFPASPPPPRPPSLSLSPLLGIISRSRTFSEKSPPRSRPPSSSLTFSRREGRPDVRGEAGARLSGPVSAGSDNASLKIRFSPTRIAPSPYIQQRFPATAFSALPSPVPSMDS